MCDSDHSHVKNLSISSCFSQSITVVVSLISRSCYDVITTLQSITVMVSLISRSYYDVITTLLHCHLAWWAVTWRTSKNHKTIKIGGWALARVWALAQDNTVTYKSRLEVGCTNSNLP